MKSFYVKFVDLNFIQTFFYLNISDAYIKEQVRLNLFYKSIFFVFSKWFFPDETFSCTSCSKVFATKPNMDSHIKKIHQNDNKKYVCETCNSSFSSAPNLKQHVKTVHEAEVKKATNNFNLRRYFNELSNFF